jgi:hypothetical protein
MKNKITIKHKNNNQPKQFSLATPAFRALFPDLQGGIKGYFFSFLQDVLGADSTKRYYSNKADIYNILANIMSGRRKQDECDKSVNRYPFLKKILDVEKVFCLKGTSIWEVFQTKIGLRFIAWELERGQVGINNLLSFEKEVLH